MAGYTHEVAREFVPTNICYRRNFSLSQNSKIIHNLSDVRLLSILV